MSEYEWLQFIDIFIAQGKRNADMGLQVWCRGVGTEESVLLKTACDSGRFSVVTDGGLAFPYFTVDGARVFEETSEYHLSKQWDALRALCHRGVIVRRDGRTVILSRDAIDMGKRLRTFAGAY